MKTDRSQGVTGNGYQLEDVYFKAGALSPATCGGSANAYTFTLGLNPSVNAPAGAPITFVASFTNTGPATGQLLSGPSGAQTAVPITRPDGSLLEGGEIQQNQTYMLIYSSISGGRWILYAPIFGAWDENFVDNDGFDFIGRGAQGNSALITSSSIFPNNHAAYTFDRWLLESDGNNIVNVAQDNANLPPGATWCCKLTVQTINKKFGIAQIWENDKTLKLRGKTVSFQIAIESPTGNAIGNIRMALVEWTGTADQPTKSIVANGSWAASGSNPTLTANWSYNASSGNPTTNKALANAWGVAKLENITIGNSANNLALLVWIDDTTVASGAILRLGNARCNPGPNALPWRPRDTVAQQMRMGRWFFKTFPSNIAPGQNTNSLGDIRGIAQGASFEVYQPLFPQTRAVGSLTTYNVGAANNNFWDFGALASRAVTGTFIEKSSFIIATNSAVAGAATGIHATVDAELGV